MKMSCKIKEGEKFSRVKKVFCGCVGVCVCTE